MEDLGVFVLMFKKIDNKWRITYWADSWVEKNVPGENSNGLNQMELMKQLISNWKIVAGKDTTFITEVKSYDNGQESFIKTEKKDIDGGKVTFRI